MILSSMEPGKWYRTNEFMDMLGVKETRMRTLLRELVAARYVRRRWNDEGEKI